MAEDGKSNREWSSSFVRNRTEMFIIAVTIFVTVQLDLNLSKIPALGIELNHAAPRALILGGLYLLYLYFTISYVFKFSLQYSDVTAHQEAFSRFNEGFKRYLAQARYLQTSRFSAAPEDNIPEETAFSAKAIEFLGNVEGTVGDAINHLQYRIGELARGRAGTAQRQEFDQDALGRAAETAVQEIMTRVDLCLKELSRETEARIESAQSMVTRAVDQLDLTYSGSIAHAVESVRMPVLENILTIKSELLSLQKEVTRLKNVLTWEHVVLGFWVPLTASFAMVLASSPKAMLDIFPQVAAQKSCTIGVACATGKCDAIWFFPDSVVSTFPNLICRTPPPKLHINRSRFRKSENTT